MRREDINPGLIVLDYYQGSYGPTLRIDVQSDDTLLQIREVFLDLKERQKRGIRLDEMSNVKLLSPVASVIIKVLDVEESTTKHLEVMAEGSQRVSVLWSGSPDYWRRCVGLVDGLLNQTPRPGHQYLTDENIDDALVELAFME